MLPIDRSVSADFRRKSQGTVPWLFCYSWEQRKLGDCFRTITDYVAAGSFADIAENVEYKDTPDFAQLVRTMDLKNHFTSSNQVFVDENAFNFLYRVNLNEDCIILPNIGNCGEVYLVKPENLPHKHNVLGPNAIMIKDCDADIGFISVLLQGSDFQQKLSLIISPNGQTKFNKTELKQINLLLPQSISEQVRLGELFIALDNLITLHRRKPNISKIKFPFSSGIYTTAWEQRKFADVFDCTIPNNTLSRAELNFDAGEVLNVHYGDVLIKYGSVIDVQRDNLPYVTDKTADDFMGSLLQDGDIVIADTAEDETTGKACEIGNIQHSKVVSGLHTMVCRPKENMALGYLGYFLNSDSYHHQLLPLMQGIKVLSLSRSNIQKTTVFYPHSKVEQQQISAFFTYVDNLITLHQRKEYPRIKSHALHIRSVVDEALATAWEQCKLGDG